MIADTAYTFTLFSQLSLALSLGNLFRTQYKKVGKWQSQRKLWWYIYNLLSLVYKNNRLWLSSYTPGAVLEIYLNGFQSKLRNQDHIHEGL